MDYYDYDDERYNNVATATATATADDADDDEVAISY